MRASTIATSVLIAALATGSTVRADAPAVTSVALGTAAPSFSLKSLDGKGTIDSTSFAGKVLVLNFWATWCPPCRAETPDMVKAYHDLSGPDVAFLGVDTTEAAPVIQTFLSAKGVPYATGIGGADAYNGFGIAYIPTTIVVDKQGIVRARWTGELPPEQLKHFIERARAGENARLDTPQERSIEKLLDPKQFAYDGDEASVRATIDRAKTAVNESDKIVNAQSDGDTATVDYAYVQTLEGNVLLAAGNAFQKIAKTPVDEARASALLGQAYSQLNMYADAAKLYRAEIARNPDDPSLLLKLARTDYRLHDYDDMKKQADAYTARVPDDADGWDFIALAHQRMRDYAAAAPLYEKTLGIMKSTAAKTTDLKQLEEANANVADESLDLANVYVALGDQAGAARTFAQSNAYADKLTPGGRYADLIKNVHERTQEGMVAVTLARNDGKTGISVAPWSGPDLPGSLASTRKYRLIVAGRPNAAISLTAGGLASGWIASFCADGLCSPGKVSFTVPSSGVKTYEFQLVPPDNGGKAGNVRIVSSDGAQAIVR